MVVTLYIILLEWWAMATGSSEDSKTTQWIQDSRERTWTRTRRQSSRKRQRQNKKHGWRLLRTAQLLTLAAVFCLADHGSKCARSDPEGDTSGSIQTGGWIDHRPKGPHEEPWTRTESGGGGIPCKVLGHWAPSHKTSEPTPRIFRKSCSQTESGDGPTHCRMAKIPEAGRRGIRAAEDQIPGKAEGDQGRLSKSRRRVCSCARCSTRSYSSGRKGLARRSTSRYTRDGDYNGGQTRRCDDTQEGSRCHRGRGRPGDQETSIAHPHRGLPRWWHEQDGFLIGRHGSCSNNDHARRPKFFCLVEYLEVDDASPPDHVQSSWRIWHDLITFKHHQPMQHFPATSARRHTYGPRQAEYVANLMKYDVDTGQHEEAFDPCLWDETMENLLYLDNIDATFSTMADNTRIPKDQMMRQIEGRTLWTLLAMDNDEAGLCVVDWQGSNPAAGYHPQHPELSGPVLTQSMSDDFEEVPDILTMGAGTSDGEVVITSYGYFDEYHGQRETHVPHEQAENWRNIVKREWDDLGQSRPLTLHVVYPQPEEPSSRLHVIIRLEANPRNVHFLLVDKIDESPHEQNDRRVVAISQQAVGYEIFLWMGINLNTVTSRTILKMGAIILQPHRRVPAQDGQFWRVLIQEDDDVHSIMQHTLQPRQAFNGAETQKHPKDSCHTHVLDRWCDGQDNLDAPTGFDALSLMQVPSNAASVNSGETFHFFHMADGHFQINIPDDQIPNMDTIVENRMRLPADGPSSLRTLHHVSRPPALGAGHTVHIMELREDEGLRLMNDDTLCLYQITFEHPNRLGEKSDKFRVIWTPRIASRERILFHLRAADLCRAQTCHLTVNHVPWREADSIIRHFQDGDFIHLRIVVAPESSVTAVRCDFRGYESTERDRVVFAHTPSSRNTTEEEDDPSTPRSRSRSRHDGQSEHDEGPPLPDPPQHADPDASNEQEESEELAHDSEQFSLLQKHAQVRSTITLSTMVAPPSFVKCDLTPVIQIRALLEELPWLMGPSRDLATRGSTLEAVQPLLLPWQGETPLAYHLYTDGSYLKNFPDIGGCGIVLIISTNDEQLCGGVFSRTCLPTAKAHSAESIAMLWAALIATQLSANHRFKYPDTPFVLEFGFDANVTGQQCRGSWTSYKHPCIQRFTRNLVYVIQSRHGFDSIHWTHIKAHRGHWWNEVADVLAKHAVTHSDMVQNSELLYVLLENEPSMRAMDWIWALEQMETAHPAMPLLLDNHLYHFRQPVTDIPPFENHFGTTPNSKTQSHHQTKVTLTFKIATFNVLTLDSKKDKTIGTGTSGRHLTLLQQCHEHGLHMVGVQETRAFRVTNKNNPHYHVIHSPCRSDGHYGIQIWLHRTLTFDGNERPFRDEDYRIVWSTPNVLAIKMTHPSLHCIVIAARGPTSDKPIEDLQEFWHGISTHVLQKFPQWKVILLCDANAHLGSIPSLAVSTCGAEPENQAGEVFHTWVMQHGIWLPSTWDQVHHGEHFTYITPAGSHQHRLDFVGLSLNWPMDDINSYVSYDIDGSLSRCDHFAAVCSFTTTLSAPNAHRASGRQAPILDREATAKLLKNDPYHLAGIERVPWSTDVHKHAVGLATATAGHLHGVVECSRRSPRKRHLSALTWNLVNWKRHLRKHQLDVRRRHKFGLLRQILYAWRNQGSLDDGASFSFTNWLKWTDVKIALLDYTLGRVQPLLQQMIRDDDAAYFQRLALRAGKIESEDGLHGLWKEVRGVLPKWKTRRSQQRYDIDDALCQHFAQLEAGRALSFGDLFRKCTQYQNEAANASGSAVFSLQDLPTLFEVEQVCRRTTPGRAPGLDSIMPEVCRYGAPGISPHVHNIILKIVCSQAEPVWYKGGIIHPIYKAKGAMDDPTSYRGVVLLDTYGKKFHAWMRSRLLPILQERKTPGQLGGLPHEQTLTGSHLLRTHGQLARDRHLSSAVIFVDVRAAFHHMLRELIFLCSPPEIQLEKALDIDHFDLETLNKLLLQRCADMPKDFPLSLRKLANDIHRNTWFQQHGTTMDPNSVIATDRGTRPGSPVADVGFNLLMSDILDDLHARLAADELLAHHQQVFPVEIPPITWVDDLAVPLVMETPQDLECILQRALQHIHGAFYSKGLQINYDKGKTEIVAMFRGPGADAQRARFFSAERETFITTSTSTHVFQVRVVPSYKHLGIRFQMDADLEHEIHCRLGQARASFHDIHRPIFKNHHLSEVARIQLLQSLVFSKMLYGCGTWYEIPRRTVQKLESVIMRYFRTILNRGFWNSHITDEQLRGQHHLPTFRLLLATARLRFLSHVAVHEHEYHRELLVAERFYNRGWLYEVEEDLAWLKTCIHLPDVPPLPKSEDDWPPFFQWLRKVAPQWKSWLRRATRQHYLREDIAAECQTFHQEIFDTFQSHGFALSTPEPDGTALATHACPECDAAFTTATGLAVHRAKKHGIHSPLREYVQSSVCPGCLKDMWTTQRVMQHLRYRQNRCLDRTIASRLPKEHIKVVLPTHLQRVKRLPARRIHHGPLLPLPHERERLALRERLRACEEQGNQRDYWSAVNPAIQHMADDKLKTAAWQWYHTGTEIGEELYEILLTTAMTLPLPSLLREKCLIGWIEKRMWDDCADWIPSSLQILEHEHMQLLQILQVWIATSERDHLRHLLRHVGAPVEWDPVGPLCIPHPKKRPRAQPVGMRYNEMEVIERMWRTKTFAPTTVGALRAHHGLLDGGTYYIVHLYSGRRREQDIQWHLERMLPEIKVRIVVLSIDTAVHATCDVNAERTWTFLVSLARSGSLLALVLGPPCETWSSARHECIMDDTGGILPGPRPLRSANRPWGLDELRPKEYRQIQMGMRLLLRGLILVVHTTLNGGSTLLEHPARPRQPERPSIWKTAVIEILLNSGLFKTHLFEQWRFGAKGVKPTTFLHSNLENLPLTMKMTADPKAIRPQTHLVGRDAQGRFRTSAAKEYPPLLNAAIATSIVQKWSTVSLTTEVHQPEVLEPSLVQFLNSLSLACSEICEHQSWLPDYQGR